MGMYALNIVTFMFTAYKVKCSLNGVSCERLSIWREDPTQGTVKI